MDVRIILFQFESIRVQPGLFLSKTDQLPALYRTLLYKIAGSQPDSIVRMQEIIHLPERAVPCICPLLFCKKEAVKYLLIFFIYFPHVVVEYFGMTLQLLSESLIISLLFCWIASFLLFYKKRKTHWLILHLIITILLSNTRDSWPYLLVAFLPDDHCFLFHLG